MRITNNQTTQNTEPISLPPNNIYSHLTSFFKLDRIQQNSYISLQTKRARGIV